MPYEKATLPPAPQQRDTPPEDDTRSPAPQPPQDRAAEESVLGGMLMSKDAIADCVEAVRGVDFYQPAHEILFDGIVSVYGAGDPVDAVLMTDYLTRTGDLSRVGGAAYLHHLIAQVPTAANAGYYANIVAERAVLRRMAEAGTRIVQLAYSTSGDVEDILSAGEAQMGAVRRPGAAEDYLPMTEIVEPVLHEIEAAAASGGEMLGVPTGFADLDRLLHGLQPGQLIVIGARPATGKSTLALDIARSAAFGAEMTSVVFSFEMTRIEIGLRAIAAEAQINLSRLRDGALSDHEWGKISGVLPRVMSDALFVDDSPNMTMPQIRSKCRRLKQTSNLRLVVIDYLQLMTSGKKVESRQQEVAEFSRALKLLAKELEVPVIAVSQLNRSSEQRVDKRPQMSDLRESGAVEQDADIIMLLHRPDQHDPDGPRAGEADIIVAKHRNGPTRDVAVAFQGHYARFVDMATGY